MRNVIGLTFDYAFKRIIYSDIQKGSIRSVYFNGSDHKILVEKQGSVEGIAFEQIHRELYWTSNSDASVSRLKLKNGEPSKVEKIIKLGPDDKPRGIAVDSCASSVYWTNWNRKQPSIQRAYLTGSGLQSIITTDIRMPNAITIDHKMQKLFWSDARLDKIERCNFDGSQRAILLTESPQHPFDLAVYGDFIYWTDLVAHAVFKANKYNGTDLIILRKNVARPMGIVAVAFDTLDCTLNPCLKNNGNCSDICSVSLNGTVICSCFKGRSLIDETNCIGKRTNCSYEDYRRKLCKPDPCGCKNGGTCVVKKSEEGHYNCVCPINFIGAHCDKFVPTSCNHITCPDGGDCYLKDKRPYCKCAPGTSDYLCDKDERNAESCRNYCMNGGTCTVPSHRELPPLCS